MSADRLREAAMIARELSEGGSYDPRIRAALPAVADWLDEAAEIVAVQNYGAPPVIARVAAALLDTRRPPGVVS